jgi:hypothetical protein
MPVVINEFEVLDTPQPPPAAEAAAAPPPAPDGEDLRRLLAQQAEAQLRLWAH